MVEKVIEVVVFVLAATIGVVALGGYAWVFGDIFLAYAISSPQLIGSILFWFGTPLFLASWAVGGAIYMALKGRFFR